MAPPHLDILPKELLHYICELVESHRQSLHAFCLASKTCHTAALPLICRHVCLVIRHENRRKPTTRLDLVPRIVDWLSLLDRRSAARHVRSLIVTQKSVDPWPEYLDPVDRDDPLLVSPERECDWDRWSEPAAKHPTTEHCETTWERLSQLIDRLPALASFTWDCSWPLPGPVLEALRPRPLVNLRLDAFWFADAMRVENTSPPELALLSDSRLRSIRSRSIEIVGYREGDYTHEAILDLVSGINPHIRNVSFLAEKNQHSAGGQLMYDMMRLRNETAPWPGLRRRDNLSAPRARLQSLEVGPLTISLFQTIFDTCVLTDLKVLKLRVHYNYKGLEHIASSVRFHCLKSLVLGAERRMDFQESEHGERDLAVPFLSSLPPLEAIRFIAQVDQDILENIFHLHGPSIRRLWFAPPSQKEDKSFNAQHIARLRKSLPLLEDLAISVPRSLGDESELAIYNCLGTFSRLRKLALYLDCDDANLLVEGEDNYDTEPVLYADFDDFDKGDVAEPGLVDSSDTRQVRNGHVRHALLNAALDQNLARAVFHAIATSKPGLASDVPLQRLELRPIRGDYYMVTQEIVMHLSQWWLVEAFAGTDVADNPDPILTPIRCPGDRAREGEIPALPELERGLEPIFRKIWPGRGAGGSWYYDWCSMPLRMEVTGTRKHFHN